RQVLANVSLCETESSARLAHAGLTILDAARSCDPRSRGLSEHRVFSCEECGFPAHVPGWRDHWEAHLCLQCQAQRVPRDTAGRCEPVDCNMTVFRRTLLSILHSQVKKIAWFNRT